MTVNGRFSKALRSPRAADYQPLPTSDDFAVELFIIHCTTCKARLKVRDESAIGDILACPKCSSMVHVVPPIGWHRAPGVQASLSESAIRPSPSEILKPLPTKAKAAVVAPPLPARRVTASKREEVQPRAAAAPIAVAPDPAPDAPPSATLVNTFWTAVVARVKQDWMLYGGGLAVGALSGAAGLWLAVSTAKTAPPGPADAAPLAATMLAQAPPAGEQQNPPAASREKTVAFKSSSADDLSDPDPHFATGAPEELIEPPVVDPSAASSVPASAPAQAAAAADLARALPNPEAPSLKLDPAPAKPASALAVDFAPGEGTSTQPTTADMIAGADEPAKTRPAAAVDPIVASAAANGHAGGSLTVSEIEQRLASTELPAVQFDQVPLAQFLEFIGDMTGLRLTIDDAALKVVGKGRQSPLTVKLTGTTASKALGAGLKSLGLTCVARDGKLVITAAQQ